MHGRIYSAVVPALALGLSVSILEFGRYSRGLDALSDTQVSSELHSNLAQGKPPVVTFRSLSANEGTPTHEVNKR